MTKSKHSHELTDEYKLAIADVILRWSFLEWKIDQIILRLLNTDDRYGGATIRYLTTKSKIDLVKSIVKDKHGKNSKEYKETLPILNRLTDILIERNRIVHGHWYMWPDKTKTLRMVFKRGAFTEYADTPDIKHLYKTKEEITELVIELAEVAVYYGIPLPDGWPFEKPYRVYKEDPSQVRNLGQTDEECQDPPQSSEE